MIRSLTLLISIKDLTILVLDRELAHFIAISVATWYATLEQFYINLCSSIFMSFMSYRVNTKNLNH